MNEATKPRFDGTINLGHIMTFAGFILAGGGAWYGIKADLQEVRSELSYRVGSIERTAEKLTVNVEKLTTIIVTDARQDEKLDAYGRRIDALERRSMSRSNND